MHLLLFTFLLHISCSAENVCAQVRLPTEKGLNFLWKIIPFIFYFSPDIYRCVSQNMRKITDTKTAVVLHYGFECFNRKRTGEGQWNFKHHLKDWTEVEKLPSGTKPPLQNNWKNTFVKPPLNKHTN